MERRSLFRAVFVASVMLLSLGAATTGAQSLDSLIVDPGGGKTFLPNEALIPLVLLVTRLFAGKAPGWGKSVIALAISLCGVLGIGLTGDQALTLKGVGLSGFATWLAAMGLWSGGKAFIEGFRDAVKRGPQLGLVSALLALLVCAPVVYAGNTTTVPDNLGRQWLVDVPTRDTPGAGSGLGSILGPAPTAPGGGHLVDVQFAMEASEARAASAVTVFYYPATSFKTGIRFAKDLELAKVYHLSVPIDFLLWYDPFDRFILHAALQPFTYTVWTGAKPDGIESPVSVDPTASFAIEVPKGAFSLEAKVGLSYAMSILGVTDPDLEGAVNQASVSGGLAVNWRLPR